MEAAPGATAAVRNGGVAMPASSSFEPSRDEWRVVSEQSVRSSGNEDLERSKVGRSDERLIYEVQHGRRQLDVDFRSIAIDGGLENDILQQRLHNVVEKREKLQNMELELRAQISARSEVARLHNTFDGQIKEHMNANVKLQEQLHEKEQKIYELERRMDEKKRELHAIRLDSEAAWAKEDLLREQNNKLQSYMMERDNVEADRAQHIKQIHDLQEHIQEKERQFLELQEQHRIAQETAIFKDEQIRDAQTWISRAQEIDALQTSANHTLQSELRERTEQYNQLWLGGQRQFGEMERLHLHVQQLQLEMADSREKSGNQSDVFHVLRTNSNDVSRLEHANGIQLEVNGRNSPTVNTDSLENGNSETSGGSTGTQNGQVNGVPFAPSSMFGMPPYLPTALHPFVMHQHGVPHPSQVTQSPLQSLSGMPLVQNWQSQQYPEQTEGNLSRTDSHFDHEALAVNEHAHRANYVDASIDSQLDAADSVVPSPNGEVEVHDSIDESQDKAQSQLNLHQISSQFHEALRVDPLDNGNGAKEKKGKPVTSHSMDDRNAMMEHPSFAINASSSEGQTLDVNLTSRTASSDASTIACASMEQKSNIAGNLGESYQLDERALLASIARAIGSGGRTRISSTLPNRLGKMLAPLHWHDYKKKYGKLDDFVGNHPDLFLIEGDYIQLREGAQKTIAATATAAKVAAAAAAAAAPSSFISLTPSVAVTPMAHSHRSKKFSAMQSQNLNGSIFHVAGGVSNGILNKSNDHAEPKSSVGNGMSPDRIGYHQSKGPSHGKPGMSMAGQKPNNRTTTAASSPRR
ncbi:uncharacterized protein LOC121743839 isoform X3 [Salvia splendens]|uniref:uncharacterized protein LOC121743839 isoform X3 n=1 Tax=Salvia splendens TaxID=180675 RepID=UPI001C279274|nr:uncharacterized protein LOC121743839 isoform X3 [Salvia splendens]